MSKASPRAARDRLKAEQQRQRRRNQQLKLVAIIGAAVLIVVLVAGGGYLYSIQDEGEDFTGDLAPQVLQEDGSVVMAQEDAQAPVVEVYADFQCPACADFEDVNAGTLQQLAAEGEAIVHLRTVSIFASQDATAGANSLRAAAAARAAADHDRFVEYSELLWEHQPSNNSVGYVPEDLIAWGEDVGIDAPEFAERVHSESELIERYYDDSVDVDLGGSYVEEVLEATASVNERYPAGSADAFTGTPTVYVNGERLGNEMYSSRGLRGAVEDADPGSTDTQPWSAEATEDHPPDPDEEPEDDDAADDTETD
ncbi:thioredoxin domain-containing protein [Lipingzhangella sp. LS1_29]|uniref:Thioredoxin domain-containing protein n=1 Tax=Lipingzhangella rawalii TaxID=2055835 RepID=A0ABU2H412_9ACTN|nr:thioredoxin domain-containing protein [Lipingzhangella rawalii]MDS1269344.1 thioredoxin domain-containing protein [Lipingzhangella rawalii]